MTTLNSKDAHDAASEDGGAVAMKAAHTDGETLYERKAALINVELDAMGLGRYQNLTVYQEMNVKGGAQADIFTAFSAGLTVGAFTWGLLVDIIGRRYAFNLTCLLTSLFGILVAAPPNYTGICVLTALCGFGLGGNIPIDATIVLEFLPQNRRWLLPLLSIWQPIGVVVNCVIAYGLVPRYRCAETLPSCRAVANGAACCTRTSNLGWRYLMIVCGCITLGVFLLRFAVFTFFESPKFLIARGRDAEAVAVVHSIAAFNRQAVPNLRVEDFQAIDHEFKDRLDDSLNTGTSSSALGVLKQAFSRFKHLKGLFRTRIYIYLPGIIGTAMAAAAVELPGIGRKWSLVFGAIVQGVSMAMYTQVTTLKASVGLNALEYIMQSFFNAVLYGFTPEVFPAPIRGSAAGLCSTFGRLSGIVAPIAARPYIDGNSNGVLWLACGGIFVSALFLVALPIETRHRTSY
ncbi:hypothetical protein RQP46_011097 [Phenoliferia psychrophenolica]